MNIRPILQPGRVASFVVFYFFFAAVSGIFYPAYAQSSSERSPVADPPDPRPDLVSPKSGEWPFVKWSYAKAYTFNFFGARHEVLHRVFRDGKWNKHIRSVQVISREHVKTVVELVNATRGSYETSKCPFPRHAVLFFNREDKPVAGVDVCFECENLFAWPDFNISREKKYGTFNEKTGEDIPGLNVNFELILDGYKSLFRSLGQPIDYKKRMRLKY